MRDDITGIILSGGKSSRMGVNKSFLKLDGLTIIERSADLMKTVFGEVIIITNEPEDYKFLNLPLYKDIFKKKGPLGGIHSGLVNSNTERSFFLSCDMPLMKKEMIEYLLNYETNKPVLFCDAAGYHQPLAGIYGKKVLPAIENIIEREGNGEKKSFHRFLNNVDAEIINPEKLPFYDDSIYFNVNRPEDYKLIIGKFIGE